MIRRADAPVRSPAPVECPRESDVLHAVMAGTLERRSAGGAECAAGDWMELEMHVEHCEICRDITVVAGLLRHDRDVVRGDLQVPAAGQVWWRAAVRARLEATQAAARPLTWAQGVAGACAAGLALAAAGLAWPTIERSISWLGDRLWSLNPATLEVAGLAVAAVQRSLPVALTVAACVVLAPLVVYLALADD